LPQSPSAALPKSAGVIAMRNLTSAPKVRNHGSEKAGTFEISVTVTLTTRIAARWLFCSVKKAASGLSASRIRLILVPAVPF
jgi:hypothetical protein